MDSQEPAKSSTTSQASSQTDSAPWGFRFFRKIGRTGYLIIVLTVLGGVFAERYITTGRIDFGVLVALSLSLFWVFGWNKFFARGQKFSKAEHRFYRGGTTLLWNLLIPGLGTLLSGKSVLGYLQMGVFFVALLFIGLDVFTSFNNENFLGLSVLGVYLWLTAFIWSGITGVMIHKRLVKELPGKLTPFTKATLEQGLEVRFLYIVIPLSGLLPGSGAFLAGRRKVGIIQFLVYATSLVLFFGSAKGGAQESLSLVTAVGSWLWAQIITLTQEKKLNKIFG